MNKTSAVGLLVAFAGAPLFVVVSEWLFGESPPIAITGLVVAMLAVVP